MKSSRTSSKLEQPAINFKATIIVFVLLFIAILSISLYYIIDDNLRSVTIRFMIAPSSATITLNDTEYQSAKDYKIKPGEYHLLIEKEGFNSYQETITPTEDDVININVSLEVLPGNEDYYKLHPDEAYALETIWTNQMTAGSDLVYESSPIVSILPINVEYYIQNKQYVHYQISFRIDDPENVVILIDDYTGQNYDAALERIRTEGFNPEDYSIEYRDLSIEYTGTENY